jgi:hypothetical protein
MAFYPFILMSDKRYAQNPVLLNHESIHLRQQAELLILPFYIWYITEYLIRLCLYQNHHKAYRSISFEKEAYSNEKEMDYLKNRPFWNFYRYI